ncbi:MAG: hypothetical protein SCAL_001030 [Candidatus Syntrophoarchaeum caldarius]|uniref:Uncharacterized protein n=1 Tax=Candidatus Syntropharchaeum caldarium TaxID=1838285 RepID=A0A1F2P9F3_9EURY|nr:MAG: hypothetical protein SCAL_001030 [Candidatus Syntrophoarchaeum caldarius]
MRSCGIVTAPIPTVISILTKRKAESRKRIKYHLTIRSDRLLSSLFRIALLAQVHIQLSGIRTKTFVFKYSPSSIYLRITQVYFTFLNKIVKFIYDNHDRCVKKIRFKTNQFL